MSVILESYPMVKYFELKNIQINTYVTVKSLLASSMSNWTNWSRFSSFFSIYDVIAAAYKQRTIPFKRKDPISQISNKKFYFQDSISARHQNSTALKFVQENKPRWLKAI